MKTKYFLLIFILVSLLGCQQNKGKFLFISKKNEIYKTDNFIFYTNKTDEVYLYINNQRDRENILGMPISSVTYQVNDTVVNAKIIEIMFSRELDYSPFIIEVDNNTMKIAPIKKMNKKMFYIGKRSDLSSYMSKVVDKNTHSLAEDDNGSN